MFSTTILLFCGIAGVVSGPAIPLVQCKSGDDDCVTKAVQTAYPLILNENSEIGAQQLDPLFHKVIEGNLSILKFKLFNTTVTGFKDCQIEKAKYDEAADTLQINMLCPYFNLEGQYDANGRLIVLPVEGNGDYSINTKKYKVVVDLSLNTINKNGKNYKHVNSFKILSEPLEPVAFEFKNLFNGQKDLADAVLTFANQNWKEVSMEVQGPVFTANFKKLVKNANKYLSTIPTDEYTSQ